MEKHILDRDLTFEEQKVILGDLFGFSCVKTDPDDDKHVVIYDDEGDEFYWYDANLKYNLKTIRGIIAYAQHISAYNAVSDHNFEIRKLLDIRTL